MELKEEDKSQARFTAIQTTWIAADNGTRCASFEAGETKSLHRDLFSAALRAGLVPEDALTKVEEAKPAKKQTQEDMVSEGLVEAITTLIARGDPKDFTQLGQPRAASVKSLVDFDFTAQDVRRAFEQAMHEVEQDGDDSTEHSE